MCSDGSQMMCKCSLSQTQYNWLGRGKLMGHGAFFSIIILDLVVGSLGEMGSRGILIWLGINAGTLIFSAWMVLGRRDVIYQSELKNKTFKPKEKELCKEVCSDPSCHNCRWLDVTVTKIRKVVR